MPEDQPHNTTAQRPRSSWKRRPVDVTWAVFRRIRHGDVLLCGPGRTPRLVLIGPGDELRLPPEQPSTKIYCDVPIHRKSWTGRARTCLNYHMLRHAHGAQVYRPRKQRQIVSLEQQIVATMGLSWQDDLQRELEEIARLQRAFGYQRYSDAAIAYLRRLSSL